jgi:hypothetical protein
MDKETYRLSDLIDIRQLMRELMDPEQEAEALCDEDGVCWETLEELQQQLRRGRLHPVEILFDDRLPQPEQRELNPKAIGAGTAVDFLTRILSFETGKHRLFLTLASVRETYGDWLSSVARWLLANGRSTTVEPAARRRPSTRPARRREDEIVDYLMARGPLSEEGQLAAIEEQFGVKVARQRLRELRDEGRVPKAKPGRRSRLVAH